MTVADLIRALQALPGEMDVIVTDDDHERAYNVDGAKVIKIHRVGQGFHVHGVRWAGSRECYWCDEGHAVIDAVEIG